MKKTKIILVVVSLLLFSGCSFQGKADGGVFRSSDGGESFEQKSKVGESGSFGKDNVSALEIDLSDSKILYVGTSNFGILRTTNGAEEWVADINSFGNVEDIVINPGDSNDLYIAVVAGGVGKIMKANDSKTGWEEIFTERTSGARVLSLAMDKNNPAIVYAGDTLGGIYKTYNGGETWQSLLWADGPVKKIEIDSNNTSKVYFLTTKGVQRTDNAGANFVEIETAGTVYNIVAHPTRNNVIFISDSDGLHKSEDAGDSFYDINTLVQPEKIGSRGLAINPKNDNDIYFASGNAFYKTTDGGRSWKPIQFNSSKTVQDIVIDPENTNVIYVGTGNQGQSSGFTLFPSYR